MTFTTLAILATTAALSAAALVPALRVLAGGSVEGVRLVTGVPGGAWVFAIDPLSAWFLLLMLGAGVAALAYGTVYLAAEAGHGSVAFGRLVFSLLLAALALVVTAQSAVPFLAAWELMALGGYFAVVFDDRRDDVRRAGLVYLVATHAGTLLLFLLFGTWGSRAADLTFAALAAGARVKRLQGAKRIGKRGHRRPRHAARQWQVEPWRRARGMGALRR